MRAYDVDVARMAGVSEEVVTRADKVSAEFFEAFKQKLASKRQSALPLVALADFAWLMRLAKEDSVRSVDVQNGGMDVDELSGVGRGDLAGPVFGDFERQMRILKKATGRYEAQIQAS